jgi:hypothetical protein
MLPDPALLPLVRTASRKAKRRIASKTKASPRHQSEDDAGVWRGKAQQSGKPIRVSVDFQGYVVGK